jgi:hypothetical protein
MAEDITRKISIDVEVNSSIQQQTDDYKAAFESLRASILGLSKPLTDLSNSIGVLNTDITKAATESEKTIGKSLETITSKAKTEEQTKSKTILDSTKNTLSKVWSLFVKAEDDKSKIATDSNTKTNTNIANNATGLQQLIKSKNLQITQDVADSSYKIITESIALHTNAKVRALEEEKKKALSNTSLTEDAKNKIKNDYAQKENNVKLKGFKEQQKADIGQAITNGAVAITKVTAQSGILAPVMIAGVIANTAAQVAKIASQAPPKFAKGGYFQSDGNGAVLPGYSRNDNTNAFLRSGEAVVVSEAMRDPWARNLVSAINVAYGGRDFSVPNLARGYAVGGIFTDGGNANRYYNQPVNDQKNLANTVAYQMINNFPPVYVDVKDVNNQQNILAQTINRVNL